MLLIASSYLSLAAVYTTANHYCRLGLLPAERDAGASRHDTISILSPRSARLSVMNFSSSHFLRQPCVKHCHFTTPGYSADDNKNTPNITPFPNRWDGRTPLECYSSSFFVSSFPTPIEGTNSLFRFSLCLLISLCWTVMLTVHFLLSIDGILPGGPAVRTPILSKFLASPHHHRRQ